MDNPSSLESIYLIIETTFCDLMNFTYIRTFDILSILCNQRMNEILRYLYLHKTEVTAAKEFHQN